MLRKNNIYTWIGFILIIIIVTLNSYWNNLQIINIMSEKTKIQTLFDLEKYNNYKCTYLKDSLIKENKKLSQYWTLTSAIIVRDKATSDLKKIGDIVYLKNDSSRGVVKDIIIGGGKFNYYVKYCILFKDNSTSEIIPELIY